MGEWANGRVGDSKTGKSLLRALCFFGYQAGLLLFGAAYLAVRLARGRELPGIRERLASYSPEVRERLARMDRPVWIHAVSVGEALAARPLVEELRRRFPGKSWVVSTVTPTGRGIALKQLRDSRTEVVYLPWDFGPVVKRAIKWIRPSLFLSFETELWPVLFDMLERAGVPVAVVNGRISPRAYGRYLWVRPLMQRALSPVGLFLTQSPQDARRYAALGAAKDRVTVTGNLKWDLGAAHPNGAPPEQLRGLLGMNGAQKLWTAGSTHPGEERMIFEVYGRLKERYPTLRLLVAPRHPERAAEVEQEARRAGMKVARWSEVRVSESATERVSDAVILLDTVGELASLYRISEFVFVGGSLVPHGGHNLVEPASLGCPILTGPHLENFQAIAESLRQAKGMLVVRTPGELEQAAGRLLQDPPGARDLGARAMAVFRENQGTVKRTADLIMLRWGKVLSS